MNNKSRHFYSLWSVRDPFFDAMTHDDDDDDDEEDGFYYDGIRGEQQDPFDSAWRFGFSFGPDGMRIQEPPAFGHVLREMEEIFSQLGQWEGQPEPGYKGMTPEPWCGTFDSFRYNDFKVWTVGTSPLDQVMNQE